MSDTDQQKESASAVLDRFNGDTVKMAEHLATVLNERFSDREKLRDRDATIKELQAKVPADGSVVLTKDDAALLDAYRAHGTPAEVGTKLTDAEAATQERDTLKREKTLRQVADDTGIKPGALATVDKLYGGLAYEVKTSKVMVNGKQVEVKQAMVKRDDKEVALVDLVKQDYPEIAAILTVEAAPPARDGTPTRDRPRPVVPQEQQATVPTPTIRF